MTLLYKFLLKIRFLMVLSTYHAITEYYTAYSYFVMFEKLRCMYYTPFNQCQLGQQRKLTRSTALPVFGSVNPTTLPSEDFEAYPNTQEV